MEPSTSETETRITITATNPVPFEVSDMIYDMMDKVFETKKYPNLVFTIAFATDMDTIPTDTPSDPEITSKDYVTSKMVL